MDESPVCYLCGKLIENNISYDHVPPRQIYSQEIRRLHNPNLLTLPTHASCNHDYQLDEEYFIHSLAPLAIDSYSGKSMQRELLAQYKDGRNVKLSKKILSEFEERPSGLYLPIGKVAKRIDPDRFWRVVWKIVRGLFFHEYNRVLSENTPKSFKIVSPGDKPPEEFFFIPDEPIRGQYPGVFDYRYKTFTEVNKCHLWAMIFWDRLIMITIFHDPDCMCEICVET